MASVHSPHRSLSLERGPVSNSSLRSRPPGERDIHQSIHRSQENRAPPLLPSTLQSMLRTTTETGDIGMFAIKPSRVPQIAHSARGVNGSYGSHGAPPLQRPPGSQPYGGSDLDDRRRLPSYARDATSEVVSMYETASQKSGRRFEEPNHRSYSMSQTYSQYALNAHRSFSSLRSNPEGIGSMQRPRSPFAYPARLRRPGFRPSSPALTDGGAVDYSRRAEIDRLPYPQRTSSPSSLYAHKRSPLPPALRTNANRSTPSLLSQSSSPPRRSVSSYARYDDGTPTPEWPRRGGPTSMSSSPARSTLSLASTINLYQAAPSGSTTTTPAHPPSPLYYDYTEDFDVDNSNHPVMVEPPPQFRIDKTIPEDRPLSANWQKYNEYRYRRNFHSSSDASTVIHNHFPQSSYSGPDHQGTSHALDSRQYEHKDSECSIPSDDRTVGRLSLTKVDVTQQNKDESDIDGLPSPSSKSLKLGAQERLNESIFAGSPSFTKSLAIKVPGLKSASTRSSICTLNDNLRTMSPLLQDAVSFPLASFEDGKSVHSSETFRRSISGHRRLAIMPPSESKEEDNPHDDVISRRPSTINSRKRSSSSFNADFVQDIIDVARSSEASAKSSENAKISIASTARVIPSSSLAYTSSPGNLSTKGYRISPLHLPDEGYEKLFLDQSIDLGRRPSKRRRVQAASAPATGESEVPNFSHQIPRRLVSRSESPMLAPKPISPARQLKLKNSIPQLMKALPAVPVTPNKLARNITLLVPKERTEREEVLRSQEAESRVSKANPTMKQTSHDLVLIGTNKENHNPAVFPVELDSIPISSVSTIPEEGVDQVVQPSKSKLKLKISAILRPETADSRPWNSGENYPWSDEVVKTVLPELPSQIEKSVSLKQPKFKLKIIRASGSTMGTVRVNRETAEHRLNGGIQLRNPKDLFTTTIATDNVFSSITRHLHARRESMTGNSRSTELNDLANTNYPSDRSHGITRAHEHTPEIVTPSKPVPSVHGHPGSAFSDDSSHSDERHNLRKRISNLRSRMTGPYAARNAARSYDDLTWRDRNRQHRASISPARSQPNLHAPRTSVEVESKRRFVGRLRAHNIRAKVSEWLAEARLAISAHLRHRKTAASR